MKKNKLGVHILLNLFDCDNNQIEKVDDVKILLNDAVTESGLTKVGESFHQFMPYGVTGVLLLSESHICIHTWPEYKSAAVDIFCCSSKEKAQKVADIITARLFSKNYKQEIIQR